MEAEKSLKNACRLLCVYGDGESAAPQLLRSDEKEKQFFVDLRRDSISTVAH